jgi:hypothetical protein
MAKKKESVWVAHVKAYAAEKKIPYGQAMKEVI